MKRLWKQHGDFIKIIFVMFIVMSASSIADLLFPMPGAM